MRIPKKDLQKMYYAQYVGKVADKELATDGDGNPIVDYVDADGTIHYLYYETGTYTETYGEPVEFWATISSKLNELHARAYGVDMSAVFSEIQCLKGELPFKYGTKIWKNTPIKWKDETSKIPDQESADYTVTGTLDEFIPFDWFLLQRNNNYSVVSDDI